jgi:hypothetical protein
MFAYFVSSIISSGEISFANALTMDSTTAAAARKATAHRAARI